MKLSKTQLHKTGQSGEFLGKLLGPLPTYGLALIRNVLKLLAKNVLKQLKPLKRLKPLGLRAAASATDAAIHKKNVSIWYASFRLSKENKLNNFEVKME